MSGDFDPARFVGRWVHSHEESRDGRIVLRTPSHPFPPSRGRRSLTLDEGGRVRSGTPGPDDRGSTEAVGRWSVALDVLSIDEGSWKGTYRVEELTEDRLVLTPSIS